MKATDYTKTNPVPQKGDKIQITSVNTTQSHEWKTGDVIDVLDGKDDYWGKPGFCAYVTRVIGWGDMRRTKKRKVWAGANSYEWTIVERDGKTYVSPEQKEKRTREINETRNRFAADTVGKILSSDSLMQKLCAGEHMWDSELKTTARKVVTLARAIAEEMYPDIEDDEDEENDAIGRPEE